MLVPRRRTIVMVCGLLVAVTASAWAQNPSKKAERGYKPPAVTQGSPAAPLTAAAAGAPADRARQYIRASRAALGISELQVDDLVVTGQSTSSAAGVTHVYLRQRVDGIEVVGGEANVSVGADGRILLFRNSFFADVAAAVNRRTPGIGPDDAAMAAARHVDLSPSPFEIIDAAGGAAQDTRLSGGGVAEDVVRAKLVFQPVGPNELLLAWQVDIQELSGEHLWRITVDAGSGEPLHVEDYTLHDGWDMPTDGSVDMIETATATAAATETTVEMASSDPVNDGSSYRVFAFPAESPNDAPQSLVTNPADASASPFGWHDTNGVAGPEFTITRGNNVHAYLDQDQNNAPDAGADVDGGASLTFDFAADLDEHAQNYREAVVTNLFYWNNIYHDVMWKYGFDEASGNFQANNYGRGGGQGDYVRAEAADGGGTNNANFSTPAADAGTPRMQMYLWPGNAFGAQNQVIAAGTEYNASWARFSPAPSVAGTSGPLFDAGNGCVAADYAGAPAGFIAVVTGSNVGCQNIVKARTAETAGATAVVVALNAAGTAPILTGSLTTPGPGIPVASITLADGNAIRAAIAGGGAAGSVRKHPNHPGIRDGDFEAGIIIHEYAHGVSNRLTGGPGINCLSGNQQAGEGWSDWYALAVLANPALDDPDGPRGMGPYALFQPTRQGNGIRPRPYSRTMPIQPFTYDSIKTNGWLSGGSLSAPHGIGHGWAAILWDMTWNLVEKHGFNTDVYGPWNSGGNNRALQYVTDGLKFQGCAPNFVDARNGILAAVEALGGEDTCTVWAAFARRGLGYGATSAGTGRDAGSEAFDTHPGCREGFNSPISPTYGTLNQRVAGSSVILAFTGPMSLGNDILASHSPFSRKVDCTTLRVPSIDPMFITPREYPVPTVILGCAVIEKRGQNVYQYKWQTDADWAGTCRELVLTRKDGTQHRTFFEFLP